MDRRRQVAAFFDAWRSLNPDDVTAWFTDDAVYHNIPMERIVGRAAIHRQVHEWLSAMKGIDFEFDYILVDGDVVLMERRDVMPLPDGASVSLPIMAVMEFRGNLISAWREYFDSAQMAALFT